jgi:MFS family permease
VYCASLRTAETELIELLKTADAMVVTVLAAGGAVPATVTAGGDDDSWNVAHLAALAMFYAVRQVPKAPRRPRMPIRIKIRPVLHGGLGRLMIGIAAFEFGNVSATLLILRGSQLLEPRYGGEDAAQLAIGLYVVYNVAASLSSVPAGRAGDRRGTRFVMGVGVAAFAISYFGFAVGGSSVVSLGPWFVAAGIGIGIIETSEHSAVAALAPEDIRSSAFGVLATIQSLGNFAASALVGILWSETTPSAAFVYLGFCMALSLFAIKTTAPERPPRI